MYATLSAENHRHETFGCSVTAIPAPGESPEFVREMVIDNLIRQLLATGFEWAKITIEVQAPASSGANDAESLPTDHNDTPPDQQPPV